ncbi:hypothetical protein KSP40_PGU011568 [Platanthera guangdongensis]|uniref:Uncharacterized protein n=1 Tax=Platanthera guangdongensis TaxID=2320717 RepID=A0ABR2MRS1_9ASPA
MRLFDRLSTSPRLARGSVAKFRTVEEGREVKYCAAWVPRGLGEHSWKQTLNFIRWRGATPPSLFHHHNKEDLQSSEADYKKEEKHHKHEERLGEFGTGAAGGFAPRT